MFHPLEAFLAWFGGVFFVLLAGGLIVWRVVDGRLYRKENGGAK